MASFFDSPSMRTWVLTEDGEPVLDEGEEVVFRIGSVELTFDKSDPHKNMGVGRLLITQSRIIFLGPRHSLDFDVRFIVLHAVSRDVESYPRPCLYCQLARDDDGVGEDSGEDDASLPYLQEVEALSGDMERIAAHAVEMFLAPTDESDLIPLFEAFSNAALLNPDPQEPGYEDGDDDEDDELIYNEEEVWRGHLDSQTPPTPGGGLAVLEHLDSLLVVPKEFERPAGV